MDKVIYKVSDVIKRLETLVIFDSVQFFVSDSCNVMRDVRLSLLEKVNIKFAYGCAAHALHNLLMDIVNFQCLRRRQKLLCSSEKN